MKTTICDVCKKPFASGDDIHPLTLRGKEYDLCEICEDSPVILTEMRRTRTRPKKAKAKKGGKIAPALTIKHTIPAEDYTVDITK